MKKLKLKILIPLIVGFLILFFLKGKLRVFDYPDNSLPEWVESQQRLAEISINEGNNDKAISLLKVLIDKGFATSKIHLNLGLAYTNMKKFDLAEKEYRETLKVDPKNAEAHINLGKLYKKRGENNHALEMYKKAIELNPDLWNVYYNMGEYYNEMGLSKEAELQFKNAVKLKPDNLDSHYALAGIYDQRGNFEMAEEEYKKILDIDPRSPSANKDIGMLYSKNGMYKKGLEELEIRLRLLREEEINISIPKFEGADISFHFKEFTKLRSEIYNGMGNIYYMLRNLEKALEMYLNVKKINSNFPNIYYNTGLTYFSMKKWEEAKDMLSAAKDKSEKNIDSTYYLAIAHGNLGRFTESVKLLKEVIRLNPDNALPYKDLGVLYLYKLKDTKSGIEYLEKSLQLSPDQPEAENIRQTLLNLKR